GEAAGKHGAGVIAAEPAVLSFGADHPVAVELPVRAGLHAAEEARVVVAERKAVEIVAAAEGAAEMGADVEAGPGIIDRRGIGRRPVVVVARAEIGGGSWHGGRERNGRHSGKQDLFHFEVPRSFQARQARTSM